MVFFLLERGSMIKFTVKAKFYRDQIVCSSQVKCVTCKDKDHCEEIDFYIKSPYEDVSECMGENTYQKKNGRTRQKTHRN